MSTSLIFVTTLAAACGALQQSAAQAEPTFVDGEAQVVEAFRDPKRWVRDELWVEAEFDSDGDGKHDRMHVDVTRPRETESGLRVPVVYESSPYFAGTGSTDPKHFWDPHQEVGGKPKPRQKPPSIPLVRRSPRISESLVGEWVPRGFAVVHSEAPGTGLSQGCPTVGGPPESLAPKAVIDWLNGRARGFTKPVGGEPVEAYWCTGLVGMTGTSYNGTLALAAATTGVEGLAAIIPVAPNTSYYHYYRSNGLVRHPGGYIGEDMDVLFDFVNSGAKERREWCECNVRDEELVKSQDRVTGDWNEFWEARDFWLQLENVRAATLFAHGLNDWNVMPEHSLALYPKLQKAGVPVQLFLHQGGHGGDPPFKMMNRWFTRFLFEVENGVEEEPKSRIVRESEARGAPTEYADWPHPMARTIVLKPGAGGRAIGPLALGAADAAPGPGGATDGPREKLVDDVSKSGAELAKAEQSEHRLLYATPKLAETLHVSGTPRVTIRVASSKKAANLSVWLVSLPWAGGGPSADVVTRGWADPQNHASLSKSEPLERGKFVDVTFELQPDDQVIAAGEQLGLMIFSSDRDFTLWPEKGTELTIDLAGTRLELPVVGGEASYARAIGSPGR